MRFPAGNFGGASPRRAATAPYWAASAGPGNRAEPSPLSRYYELLTDRCLAEINTLRRKVESGQQHPMQAKMDLAAGIVTDFHSAEAARQGAEEFARVVQLGQIPEDIETVEMPAEMKGETEIRIDKLLRAIGLCSSGAEANRKPEEGAVPINGEKHREMSYTHDTAAKTLTIQVGKKWKRVRVG